MKRLFRLLRAAKNAQIAVFAGNAAFFLLLSLVPAATLALSLLALLPQDAASLSAQAFRLLPEAARPLLARLLREEQSVAVVSVSAVAAAWSASRGTYGVLLGLDRAYGLRETRPYLRIRAACFGETLLLLAAFLSALLLLGAWAPASLPRPVRELLAVLSSALLLSFLFAAVYRILPDHHPRLRQVLPGAALSAGGFLVYTALYSRFLRVFPDHVYGSLSAVAVTMLWLYVCIEILFFGAVLNAVLSE